MNTRQTEDWYADEALRQTMGLTPSTDELLEGVRLHETPAREMMNPPEFTFEIADYGGTIYKRIAEVFDRSAAEELVRHEVELAKKRAPIIAVDFDGTLCENEWPGIGATKWETVQALIAAGARLILWTNRVGPRLSEAVEWARNRELEFDAVNENLPEIKAAFTTDCRKVYADIYLDDKAAQPSAAVLGQLWETARETMSEAAKEQPQACNPAHRGAVTAEQFEAIWNDNDGEEEQG